MVPEVSIPLKVDFTFSTMKRHLDLQVHGQMKDLIIPFHPLHPGND